jgi:Fe-S-cluster-containing hydrogenase component 2
MPEQGKDQLMDEKSGNCINVVEERCSGCRICQLMCSMVHFGGNINPRLARIRVEIDRRPQENESSASIDIPHVCKQCDPAPCAEVCTEGAFERDDQRGIWTIDPEQCTGCELCKDACPYDMILMQGEIAMKCDLCGGEYMCVDFCPTGALTL